MPGAATSTLSQYLLSVVRAMRVDPRTDAELLSAFVATRDEAAFTVLVGRYAALVWANCRRALGATPDAEDAFQATFLALARQSASVRGDTLARWLYRVSQRVAQTCRRAAARRVRREARVAAPLTMTAPVSDDASAVWEEVANLPERLRLPVTLYYLDGKTKAEAGRELGVSDRAVAQRLEQALTTLRRRLLSRGFVAAAGALGTILGQATAAALPQEATLHELAVATATGRVSPVVTELAAGAVTPRPILWVAAAVVTLGAVCGAAVAFFAGPQPAPPPPAKLQTAEVRSAPPASAPWTVLAGRVTGADGRPLPQARLAVLGRTWDQRGTGLRDEVLAEGAPDADGLFRVPVEKMIAGETGRVWVFASAPGLYAAAEVHVAGGVVPPELDLRLVPGRVSGRVLGPDGAPLAGAVVRVLRLNGAAFEPLQPNQESLPMWPAPVASGPDGAFALSGFDPAANLCVSVSNPATGAAVFLDLPGGEPRENRDVRVTRTRKLAGRVLAADTRAPLGNAQVVVDFQPVAGAAPWVLSVRTDAHGRFALAVPVAPRWTVVINSLPLPYVHCRRALELPDGNGDVEIDYLVERGLTTRGRVTDAGTGKPVHLAKVRLFPAGAAPHDRVPPMTPSTTTDADGRFALAAPTAGGTLVVTAPDLNYLRADVDPAATLGRPCAAHAAAEVGPGRDPAEVVLKLTRGRTLHGRAVLPDGSPVPDGSLRCHCLIGGRDLQTPHTLPIQDGRFAVPGCHPDRTYTLVLADRTFRHGAVARLAPGGKPAEVVLQPTGAATVEVRDGADRPAPDAVTALELALPADEAGGEEPARTFWLPLSSGGPVGPDGQRQWTGLVPGARYRIGVGQGPRAAAQTVITVPPGGHRHTTLVLPGLPKE